VDGPNFSLLASDRVLDTDVVSSSDIETQLEAGLSALLQLFPEAMRMSLLSTLRSRVFLDGHEHQAVYVVTFPGVLKTETAIVKAELLPLRRRMGFKSKAVFALVALLLVALGVLVSSRWVNYPLLFQSIIVMAKGNRVENIKLKTEGLGDTLSVEIGGFSKLRNVLQLKISRGTGWDKMMNEADAKEEKLRSALIERRYLKVSFYDISGNVVLAPDGQVYSPVLPIAALQSGKTVDVELSLPHGLPISEIVLTP